MVLQALPNLIQLFEMNSFCVFPTYLTYLVMVCYGGYLKVINLLFFPVCLHSCPVAVEALYTRLSHILKGEFTKVDQTLSSWTISHPHLSVILKNLGE